MRCHGEVVKALITCAEMWNDSQSAKRWFVTISRGREAERIGVKRLSEVHTYSAFSLESDEWMQWLCKYWFKESNLVWVEYSYHKSQTVNSCHRFGSHARRSTRIEYLSLHCYKYKLIYDRIEANYSISARLHPLAQSVSIVDHMNIKISNWK